MRRLSLLLVMLCAAVFATSSAQAQWVASWTGSAHGPYPIGNPTAQPELKFALPSAEQGANDQTFRLIVKPDVWGPQTRIRLSNAFGTKPVTFDGVMSACRRAAARSCRAPTGRCCSAASKSVTVAPGESVVSDPVALPFVKPRQRSHAASGRKLAVSFHVVGESGPMTWHAKALQTSYISAARHRRARRRKTARPRSRSRPTSWFFLDEVDMHVAGQGRVIVGFGDSITDGTGTTINGDDRWPDVLSRRLHAAYGDNFVVVNQGIGGNQVVGPGRLRRQADRRRPERARRGSTATSSACPASATVIWLEGINDFGAAERQRRGRDRGLQEGRRPSAREDPGGADLRRHADLGAQQHADARPARGRGQAQGAERIPAHQPRSSTA